ncbi:MAG: hypothetical protein HUJ31_14395 [Pseudomonadales bacterium]|nr:hypothetical protein [Pseudomonadales bacterium]
MANVKDFTPEKTGAGDRRGEAIPLVLSALFGGTVSGVFVVLVLYAREPDKYQTGPFIAGLAFFGLVIAICTFVFILVYGIPVHLILRRYGIDRFPCYLLAGIIPAVPVLVMNFPELYATLRVAAFGVVATSSIWLARFMVARDRKPS